MKTLPILDHNKLTEKGKGIVLGLLANKTYRQIVTEVDCDKSTVSYYAKKLGINRQVKEKVYSKDECKDAVLAFYNETGKVPSKEDFIGHKINYHHVLKSFKSWNSLIEYCKLPTKNKSYLDAELISLIQEFNTVELRVPQARDFINNPKYPSYTVYQDRFGSWNKAVELAGFTPNINDGYGTRTLAKDGILYRSQTEAHFVNHHLFDIHDYEYEKEYGNGWLFDFYLPEKDLYIEIDGGIRPERIKEKINFCNINNIKLLVITKEEVYKNNFALVV